MAVIALIIVDQQRVLEAILVLLRTIFFGVIYIDTTISVSS